MTNLICKDPMPTLMPDRPAPPNHKLARAVSLLDALHDEFGLPYRQVAQIIGANESTLHRWRSGDSAPSLAHERTLRALREFVAEFRDMFGRATDDGREWLVTSVPALGDREPLSLLVEGRVERVTALLGRGNRGEAA
jgi:putative toxin-antitoxin system antitoxin component (TIGR02293 family)